MPNNTLADVLEALATAATGLGTAVPGVGGIVAKIASITFGSAAAFARAGRDPVAEIQRIHSADESLKRVHDEWEEVIKAKFPTSVPPPPPTERSGDGSDVYEEEES